MRARLTFLDGRAGTLFKFGFTVDWWFHYGYDTVEVDDWHDSSNPVQEAPDQFISPDLGTDRRGYMVRCPMVEPELLYR